MIPIPIITEYKKYNKYNKHNPKPFSTAITATITATTAIAVSKHITHSFLYYYIKITPFEIKRTPKKTKELKISIIKLII